MKRFLIALLAVLALSVGTFTSAAASPQSDTQPLSSAVLDTEPDAEPDTESDTEPDAGPDTESDAESDVILLVEVYQTQSATAVELPFLACGGDLSQIALPQTVSCLPQSSEAYPMLYQCPVTWDLTGVDVTTAGRKTIFGMLHPEAGYVLAETFDTSAVTCQLMVTQPEMERETLKKISIYVQEDVVLPIGGDLASALGQDWKALCTTQRFGEYFQCPVRWDTSEVDVTAAGTYFVTAIPQLPEGFAPPEDAELFRMRIGVVSPDYIDLSAVMSDGCDGQLHLRWLYQPENVNSTWLEYAVGDGSWTPDPGREVSGGATQWKYGAYGRDTGVHMLLNLNSLELHTDYAFRLTYDGNQVSSVFHIRLENNDFVVEVGGKGGDRDGGDSGNQLLPDFDQPAPPVQEPDTGAQDTSLPQGSDALETEDSPSDTLSHAQQQSVVEKPTSEELSLQTAPSAAAPQGVELPETEATLAPPAQNAAEPTQESATETVTETVTETYTAISRMRLEELLETAEGSSVLFSKNEVSVELSAAFLRDLQLGSEELLTVTIQRPRADTFSLRVQVAEREILSLPDTQVYLQWQGKPGEMQCVDAEGNVISDAAYDAQSKALRCAVGAGGTYRIIAAEPDAAAKEIAAVPQTEVQTSKTVTVPAAGILCAVLLTVGAVLTVRKRRHE